MPRAGESRGDPDGALDVAVIRLPFVSNATDADALALEPGVRVRFIDEPGPVATADLVVLPGTRATVHDLAWLRDRGLADALCCRAEAHGPILAICGGFQMCAHTIDDPVESRLGRVAGLGLLPTRVRFEPDKILGRPTGTALGQRVTGYEIHHGRTEMTGGEPFLDGCRQGTVWGTTWHGIFENDGLRREFLRVVAAITGSSYAPVSGI